MTDHDPSNGLPARPGERKARLVVADDEPLILKLMQAALEKEGFEVRTACDGQEALEAIRAEPPDIAVVDLWMPRKDGFSVCRELKADPGLQHLPVVILSAAGGVENRIQGLDSGADDFLTKPFSVEELIARIRMILRRMRQGLDANPLTHLPGNVMIENRISQAVASQGPFAVLYLDLNDFKAYNDRFGYDAGDRVIRATARLLVDAVRELGQGTDFLGHIGGDDFIIVSHPDRMETLCRRVVSEFDRLSPSFYSEEDRARGKILARDRQGRLTDHPLLSISIGVCHNGRRRLDSYAQVSQICAELKEFAKLQDKAGSRFVIDRRAEQ